MNSRTKFKVDIFQKMAEISHKTCQKQALFTSFRDINAIFLIQLFTDFDASKSVRYRVIFYIICENPVSQNWQIWVGNSTLWILFFHSFILTSL